MVYEIASGQAATPQAAVSVITVGATQRVRIVSVHLSVPDAQTASLDIGTKSFETHGDLNMDLSFGKFTGAVGDDVTVTSSGGVSWVVVYNLEEV